MDYDFVVIGGGSAGYAAAQMAVAEGLKVAVVDGGAEVGGLCILRGCMPSKTLLESANRMRTLRRAEEFGLRAGGLESHADEIIARKRRLIGGFADYRRGQLERGPFDFIRARAGFVDAHTIRLEWPGEAARTISARSFLVATGSVINQPPLPGLAECGALTSDDVLDRETLPDSLIVLGAGPVGLELAHYHAMLGVPVTILQRSGQLLRGTDRDVAEALENAMRALGLAIFTGTKVTGIACRDGKKVVTFEHGGATRAVEAAEILNALGRRPNIDGLDLAAAGIDATGGRVNVNAHQQTNQPHVFAAGDVGGHYEIVHLAVIQGEIVGRNAAAFLAGKSGADLEAMDYRLKLFAVFTEPQVAAVGLTEIEAKARGLAVRVATYPFDDHGKSLVMGEPEGFVKLIADAATGEILGGAVVGPHGSDLIHEIVVAMRFRATAAQLAAIPHYHPTLNEIWTYPAEELANP